MTKIEDWISIHVSHPGTLEGKWPFAIGKVVHQFYFAVQD
jgi:hypothetical protein